MEGIKQPALENHLSLSNFLLSNGIDTSEILCFRDTTALKAFYKTDINLPDARFFNREKVMVDYRSSGSDCNAQVSPFIEKGDSINQMAPVKGKSIDGFLKGVVSARTGQGFALDSQEFDVYLIVYWAKYLGKLNKRYVRDWQELVRKGNQKGKKTRMILVNTDYQSIWGVKSSDVAKIKY